MTTDLYERSLATARSALAHQFSELKAQAERMEQALLRYAKRGDIDETERHECQRRARVVRYWPPTSWDEVPDRIVDETNTEKQEAKT